MNLAKELNEFPRIETERLILRKLTDDDSIDVFQYAQLPEVTEFLPWYPHKTIQDSIGYIKFAEEQFAAGTIVFGIELKAEEKIIGSIDLRNLNEPHLCADSGYAIAPAYWGKGIVTEALSALIKYGFENLNLNRIEAHCEEENRGSWKVMEKCGMKYEGILREKVFMKEKFRSMKMYSILRKEWSSK